MDTIDDLRTANLKQLATYHGGTTKLAEKIGKSSSQVSQWINRSLNSITQRPRVVSSASCRDIETALGLPLGWMDRQNLVVPEQIGSTSNPPPGLSKFDHVPVRVLDDSNEEFVQIKMVSLRLSAGIQGFRTEPDSGGESTLTLNRGWIERKGFDPEALVAVRVRGESMEPQLYDGDTIVINTADKTPVDGGIFAVNYEGEAIVKRMARDAGDWWLTSDNADQRKFHRKICRGDDCLVVGRVVRRETDRL